MVVVSDPAAGACHCSWGSHCFHVQDALAPITETPGLDQSHAAFRAEESVYC